MTVLVLLLLLGADGVSPTHEPVRSDSLAVPASLSSEDVRVEPVASSRGRDRWLAEDKLHHFSYSLGITGLSYHAYHCQLHNQDPGARYFAISVASVAGIGKELYDAFLGKTGFSYRDLIADAAGIAVGVLVFAR
jgi:uncharacterized protein YfiM (DUF2279 family)